MKIRAQGRRRLRSRASILCFTIAGLFPSGGIVRTAMGAESDVATPAVSPEPGWPQWRGPQRDGVSDETGLLREWPEGGPPRIWTSDGLGHGWSSPVISGNRIFITGDIGDDLVLHALDLDGRPVWRTNHGASWTGSHPGARSTCAIAEGRVFLLNAHGRLGAFDAGTGRELWSVDVIERFGGENIRWAISECLLIDGDRVIVTAGGAEALMAALDAKSGKTVWQSEPLRLGPSPSPAHQRVAEPAGEADPPGYASPILFSLRGRRHIVGCSNRHAFGVDADTGRLLWTRPMPTKYQVIAATPVLWRDAVFVTAPDGDGGRMLRIVERNGGVDAETVWTSDIDTAQHGLIAVGDSLFGPYYRQRDRWARLDAASGAIRYDLRDLAMGAAIHADERLICVTQTGEAVLLEAGSDGFHIRGRFDLAVSRASRAKDCWAHPVLLDGRLYLRYHDRLECFDIRRTPGAVGAATGGGRLACAY